MLSRWLLETLYSSVNYFSDDEDTNNALQKRRAAFCLGISLALLVPLYGLNLILWLCPRPWLLPFKIQPKRQPELELVVHAVAKLVLETLLFQPLSVWFVLYPLLQPHSSKDGDWDFMALDTIPNDWSTILWQIVLSFAVTDTAFYWCHRTLHHPRLYSGFHKQHHEFRVSVGVAATYSGTLESATNAFSTMLGPLLLRNKMHFSTLLLFTVLRLWETVDAHSGYSLPWSPWSVLRRTDRHDFHHSHNLGNFGMFPFWDAVMGTDMHYMKWKQQSNNK